LQGGPFSSLYIDIIKYPRFIFSEEVFNIYDFSLEDVTQIDDNQVLVLAFKQKPNIENPLYFGKMYIDAKSLAIINVTFQLNVEDKVKAGLIFTRKNPRGLTCTRPKCVTKLTTENKMANGFLPILEAICRLP